MKLSPPPRAYEAKASAEKGIEAVKTHAPGVSAGT
ncbi:DUF1508 domain-containing protein [Mycobacterium haemophilum]